MDWRFIGRITTAVVVLFVVALVGRITVGLGGRLEDHIRSIVRQELTSSRGISGNGGNPGGLEAPAPGLGDGPPGTPGPDYGPAPPGGALGTGPSGNPSGRITVHIFERESGDVKRTAGEWFLAKDQDNRIGVCELVDGQEGKSSDDQTSEKWRCRWAFYWEVAGRLRTDGSPFDIDRMLINEGPTVSGGAPGSPVIRPSPAGGTVR